MQRYFVNDNVINEKLMIAIINDSYVLHHIKNVMRMKCNDNIILCYNHFDYLCVIESITNVINLRILEKKENKNELNAYVCVAQGLVRREKKEEVLRRLVELGCKEYLPVEMERSIVKLNKLNENQDRIKTIIKECSEQSERGQLMNCPSAITFKSFIDYSKTFDYCFVCYEESGRGNQYDLNNYLNQLPNKKILVLVGPEGGISLKELEILKNNNFHPIGLGKRILRTETAPLFIMSVIGYHLSVLEGESNED